MFINHESCIMLCANLHSFLIYVMFFIIFSLKFPSLGFVGGVCFSFKVHQYGEHMGALIFYIRQGDKATVQWQRTGSYGNQWETERVDLTLTADMQVQLMSIE